MKLGEVITSIPTLDFDEEIVEYKNSSFTVQKNTEVIHGEVEGGRKITCYSKENQSEFSEKRRLKDLDKKHSERKSPRQLRSSDSVRDREHSDTFFQLESRGAMAASSAAKDSRDVVRRAEDLCRNQRGSQTEHYGHSCSIAMTGACNSENTDNGGCPTASAH